MFFSILIGVIIFGYAGWALYRSIMKSRKGKCASCELAKVCKTNCGAEGTPGTPPVLSNKKSGTDSGS